MALFQNTIHQRVYDIALSSVLIVSLFLSTASVHAVNNATSEIVSFVAVSDEVAELRLNAPSTGFPVAGERAPRWSQTARLSFYTSNYDETDDSPCIPSSGIDLCEIVERDGIIYAIATPQRGSLYLGTQVRFPELDIPGVTDGTDIFTVEDRMNARYNHTNYIDIYVAVLGDNGKVDPVASKKFAKSLGVVYTTMEIF